MEIETKKDAKYRWWFITVNNPIKDWATQLKSFESDYAIGQLEQGENGTIHIQALLWFRNSIRPSHFKNKQAWSKGISSEDAVQRIEAYVSKTSTRLEGPIEIGTRPIKRNNRRDWEQARNLAKEGRFEEIDASIHIPYYSNLKKIHADSQKALTTDNIRGLWIFGKPGLGKSHYVRMEYPNPYIKPQNKWFDGYKGEEAILLDDFDSGGACLGHYLKIWMDKWSCNGEIKGATVPLKHKIFIVTSNYLPEQIWPQDSLLVEAIQRRCIFINFYAPRQMEIGNTPGTIPSAPYQTDLYNWLNLDNNMILE